MKEVFDALEDIRDYALQMRRFSRLADKIEKLLLTYPVKDEVLVTLIPHLKDKNIRNMSGPLVATGKI